MIEVRPVRFSEALFGPMLAEAGGGDGRFLLRLRDQWLSGAVRFDKAGEILLGAFTGGRLAGVGGLSHDPYEPAPGLARLRHLYVLEPERGRGVGGLLVGRLLEHARTRFTLVRLRTRAAARFYERFGFVPTDRPSETHRLAF